MQKRTVPSVCARPVFSVMIMLENPTRIGLRARDVLRCHNPVGRLTALTYLERHPESGTPLTPTPARRSTALRLGALRGTRLCLPTPRLRRRVATPAEARAASRRRGCQPPSSVEQGTRLDPLRSVPRARPPSARLASGASHLPRQPGCHTLEHQFDHPGGRSGPLRHTARMDATYRLSESSIDRSVTDLVTGVRNRPIPSRLKSSQSQ
jgi:hypothetical protein